MDGALQKSMSRTGLLKLGAVTAFLLGAGPAARAVASDTVANDTVANGVGTVANGRQVRGPRYLRLATYVPLVGSTFRIHRSQSSSLSVKLVSATRLPSEVGESFSLIFRGHGNAKLGQATHTIEHPRLGEFPLFLVPVGPAFKGQDFEAIVNRIPSSLMPRV
jgi:hypothetical protein